MESVPPCQRMSDGLPARWTPPCQGPFTSCGWPLICLMTNDYPVKSQAGGHRIPMYVCVCMSEGFYMLCRGSPLWGLSARRTPSFTLLLQQKKGGGGCLRRQGGHTQGNTHTVTGPLLNTQKPRLTSQTPAKQRFTRRWANGGLKLLQPRQVVTEIFI